MYYLSPYFQSLEYDTERTVVWHSVFGRPMLAPNALAEKLAARAGEGFELREVLGEDYGSDSATVELLSRMAAGHLLNRSLAQEFKEIQRLYRKFNRPGVGKAKELGIFFDENTTDEMMTTAVTLYTAAVAGAGIKEVDVLYIDWRKEEPHCALRNLELDEWILSGDLLVDPTAEDVAFCESERGSMLYMMPNGDVVACPHSKTVLCRYDELDRVFLTEGYQELLARRQLSRLPKRCQRCEIFGFCRGGCMAEQDLEEREVRRHCGAYRAAAESALRRQVESGEIV